MYNLCIYNVNYKTAGVSPRKYAVTINPITINKIFVINFPFILKLYINIF